MAFVPLLDPAARPTARCSTVPYLSRCKPRCRTVPQGTRSENMKTVKNVKPHDTKAQHHCHCVGVGPGEGHTHSSHTQQNSSHTQPLSRCGTWSRRYAVLILASWCPFACLTRNEAFPPFLHTVFTMELFLLLFITTVPSTKLFAWGVELSVFCPTSVSQF